RVCGNVAAVVAPVNERFDARCFDRNCGLRERHDVDADPESALMESIYQQCHRYLLATGEAERGGLWRRVHPAVVAHSMIGVVPPDLPIADLFAPYLAEAKQRLESAQALVTGRGRPTKAIQKQIDGATRAYEYLKNLQAEFEPLFADHADEGIVFFTRADHCISSAAVLNEDGTISTIGAGGVFNHGLFAPGEPARATEALRGPFFCVLRPDDALALQSLGARRAEGEDLHPERGYLWCGAIGAAAHAGTVRKVTRR